MKKWGLLGGSLGALGVPWGAEGDFIGFVKKDKNMKEFTDIIKDSPIFPIITDKNQTVLSMPPLINGDHSKIKLETKNIFIEITATDLTKANIALNTIVSMFSQVTIYNLYIIIMIVLLIKLHS